jgi:hypothetical protein
MYFSNRFWEIGISTDGVVENPQLSFSETASGELALSSPFAKFEVKSLLTREMVRRALLEFENRLRRAAREDLAVDVGWLFAR